MQMKAKICLTDYWGLIMSASLATRIKAYFNAMETSQFTFNQKAEGYAISWKGYAYCVLGFSGSTINPFSEA
jgi:hypothetical protein